ncbi:hypothetical protein, partial [Saccharothrix sp. ST-888]|uniref:hypothetical protein n=1 Tax=Saccharothrix sp. ST-888 TaxID=1427391 RepID=UPI000AE0D0FA
MLDNTEPQQSAATGSSEADGSAVPRRRRRRAVPRPAGAPQGAAAETAEPLLPAETPTQPSAGETPGTEAPAAEPVAEKPVRA